MDGAETMVSAGINISVAGVAEPSKIVAGIIELTEKIVVRRAIR